MKAMLGLGMMLAGLATMVAGAWRALAPVATLYRETIDAPLDSNATGEGVVGDMVPGLIVGALGAGVYVVGAVMRRAARARRPR